MSMAKASLSKQNNVIDFGKIALHTFKDKDGLPQNAVWAMTFDKKGYLWLGTEDGAAYYNGRVWKVVNLPNRTTSNYVLSMAATNDGSIWFGTYGAGLSQLKDGKWTTYDTKSGLPNDQVHSLHKSQDIDGSPILWIGMAEGGLAKIKNGKLTVLDTKSVLPKSNVQCILESRYAKGSTLWIGLDGGGLARLQNGQWKIFNTESGLPDNKVSYLMESKSTDGHDILWICTYGGGLVKLEKGQWTIFNTESGLPSNYTRCLLETPAPDGTKTLWVGTYGGGLARLQNGQWHTFNTNSGLPCNDVRGLMASRDIDDPSVIWVSLDGNGISRLQNWDWVSYDTSSGLSANIIYNVLETKADDGNSIIWVGTYSGGLSRLHNGKWDKFDTKSGLPHNTVYTLLETKAADGQKMLLAGTEDGLAKLHNGKWTIFDTTSGLPDNCIKCLLETHAENGDKILWVGTRRGGLAKLENGRWTIFNTKSGLPHNLVQCLLETRASDDSSIIWAGTRGGGIARLHNGKWTIFDTKSGLPNNHIEGLIETKEQDGRHTLWAGTYGGVAMLDLNATKPSWTVISDATNPALPNSVVYQIREDAKHRVYAFTNKGIARLTRRTPTVDNPACFSIYTFTTEDGLPSNECNAGASRVDSYGRIWVGTILGIAVFDPNKEIKDTIAKPLYIERAEQLNGSPFKDGAILAHNENNLVFEYSLLSFIREQDTVYQVQLLGFDKKPSQWTRHNRKEYTNLPNGNYIFKVWAKDYQGNISSPIEKVFKIRPAPWKSWWAYMLYAGAVTGIGIGGSKLRTRVLEQRNQTLEEKIAERTAELAKALDEVKVSQKETEKKNQELLESQQRADRIFSALAEALPGTVLDGKYLLEEKIGLGGFGVVYRGTHLAMQRPIAVKVFKPAPGNDSAESLERFQQEAVSACRINHLNAVSVLDSGISAEGIAYLVMELLQGHSLTQEMRKYGKLSAKRCAEILIPVCEVLSKAHQSGIIHRDIKPDNIFLHQGKDGEVVKVVDFGIAKLTENSQSIEMKNLTVTGGIVGTPAYMSPERLTANSYDGKADVYSVGVLLYEMLSGQVPFPSKGESLVTLIVAHLTQAPPPLRKFNSTVSDKLEAVVLEALEKDPKNRPTAKELAQSISEIVEYEPRTSIISSVNTSGLRIVNKTEINYDSLDSEERFICESDTISQNLQASVLEEDTVSINLKP